MVDGIVDRFGEFIKVTVEDGTTYKVQRHYIALHGIKEKNLKELGFDETEAN